MHLNKCRAKISNNQETGTKKNSGIKISPPARTPAPSANVEMKLAYRGGSRNGRNAQKCSKSRQHKVIPHQELHPTDDKPSPLPRSLNQSRHSDTNNLQQPQHLSSRARTLLHNCRSSRTQQCATSPPVIAIPSKPPKSCHANLGRLRHNPHHATGSSFPAHEQLLRHRNDRLRASRLPNLPEIRCSLLTEFLLSLSLSHSLRLPLQLQRLRAHDQKRNSNAPHNAPNDLLQSNLKLASSSSHCSLPPSLQPPTKTLNKQRHGKEHQCS
jgi:hypothetical protein